MDGAAPNYALALHLKSYGGRERARARVLGRSSPCLVDDPCVSRQHCVFAFDARSGGYRHLDGTRPGRPAGAQQRWRAGRRLCRHAECTALFHGDILTLPPTWPPSAARFHRRHRPWWRHAWEARVGADRGRLVGGRTRGRRYELQGHTRANQALIDPRRRRPAAAGAAAGAAGADATPQRLVTTRLRSRHRSRRRRRLAGRGAEQPDGA